MQTEPRVETSPDMDLKIGISPVAAASGELNDCELAAAVLDILDAIVVVLDQSGRIVRVNRACERLTGYAAAELVGTFPWDTLLTPDEAEGVRAVFAELGAGSFPNRHENHWRTKDGGPRLISWANTAILDQRGGVRFVVGSGIDITERRSVERSLRESEERFRMMFQNANDAVWVRTVEADDPDGLGQFVEVNDVACQRLGYTRDEFLRIPPRDIRPPEANTPVALKALSEKSNATFEAVHVARDGRRIPVEVSSHLFVQGGRRLILSISRDITERKRAEEALREANEQLKVWVAELEERNREAAAVSEMGELLQTCTSPEEAYEVLSHLVPRMFPGSAGAFYMINSSRTLADAVCHWGGIEPRERAFAPEECWGLRRGRAFIVEQGVAALICRHVHEVPEGATACIPMTAQGQTLGTLHLRLKDGVMSEAVRRLSSIVAEGVGMALANLRLRQALSDQAVHDPLTGLFNRRYLEEMLNREVSRATRAQRPLGVAMIDVDHFKRFNDVHGHEAGDLVLSAIGAFLRSHVRAEDIACRYGGEELLLALPDTGLEEMRARAEALREGIRDLRIEYRHQLVGPVTVSIGVATYPAQGTNATEVVRRADMALYAAKAAGRDRVVAVGEL